MLFETMWENTVQPDRPQMTIRSMRIEFWIPKAIGIICDTYCFSTATMVAGTCLNVVLHVHCLSSSIFSSVIHSVGYITMCNLSSAVLYLGF